jgi:twitching motility protein PilU
MSRALCTLLAVAALGAGVAGCVPLVLGGAAIGGMMAVDRRTAGTQVEDEGIELRAIVSQRLMPKQDGKGRAAAVEVMLNTPLISDMIFKGEVSDIKEVMKKSRNLGMQTFDQALFDLFEAHVITYEDALRNADSINDLRLQIKLNSQRARSTDLSAGTEHFAIV